MSCCWKHSILWGSSLGRRTQDNTSLIFLTWFTLVPKKYSSISYASRFWKHRLKPVQHPPPCFPRLTTWVFLGESWAQVQYLTLLLLSCQPEKTQSKPSKWSSKALSPGLKEVPLPIWSLPLWAEGVVSLMKSTIPSKEILYKSLLLHFLTSFLFSWSGREDQQSWKYPWPFPLQISLEIYLFIYFRLCWVFVAACGLSLAAASSGHSLVASTGFSHCAGFSCGARAPGMQASAAVAHRLSYLGFGIKPTSPALAGVFFTREALLYRFCLWLSSFEISHLFFRGLLVEISILMSCYTGEQREDSFKL